MTIALETKGLEKSFGGLRVTRDLTLRVEQGARHALIGPNGAGKTTVINLLTGVLQPNAGRILLEGNDITDLPVHKRVLRGLSRTFQINQLYADLTPLETIGLAVSERLGRGGDWWRRMGTRDDVNREIAETLSRFHLLDVMNERSSGCSRSQSRSRPNHACCCSMNPPRVCPRASATIFWRPSPRCRATSRCF
jgi:branched-chain amino acid transport system ATP-binding protein